MLYSRLNDGDGLLVLEVVIDDLDLRWQGVALWDSPCVSLVGILSQLLLIEACFFLEHLI